MRRLHGACRRRAGALLSAPVGASAAQAVTTIEGRRRGRQAPVQQAWLDRRRAAVRLLPVRPDHVGVGACWQRNPNPTDADIDAAMTAISAAAAPMSRIRAAIKQAAKRKPEQSRPFPQRIDLAPASKARFCLAFTSASGRVASAPEVSTAVFSPDAFIRIDSDGEMTLILPKSRWGRAPTRRRHADCRGTGTRQVKVGRAAPPNDKL